MERIDVRYISHFFDKNYIKEVIDGLAMHKMNILHLHLVDNQGWRIEIKKYPKLTEIGAWRIEHEDEHWNSKKSIPRVGETGTYGVFLTQEDLKELIKYAQEKNIEIIPEIEMPAHVMSAIASYPELSCFENQLTYLQVMYGQLQKFIVQGKKVLLNF